MTGCGLHTFSFNIASGKAQDRLPHCVLPTLPDKPRKGRGSLWPPFKGSRATEGTTEAESSLSVRMVWVLANFRPRLLLTAEGYRPGRVETAQEQVPVLGSGCASQLLSACSCHLEACPVSPPPLWGPSRSLPCPGISSLRCCFATDQDS